MKYSSKAVRLVLLLALCAMVFAVVGGVAAQDDYKVLVTGRQMTSSDISTLDPSLAEGVDAIQVGQHFFPGLANMNEETAQVGEGVATWTVSDDGLTYTFDIKQGIPWVRYNADSGAVEEVTDDSGNVRMVTAQDFAYGIMRSLDPRTASPYQTVLTPWIAGGVEFGSSSVDATDEERQALIDAVGVEVIDDHTLAVTASTPSAVLEAIFTMWVTWAEPQWSIEANGDFWIDPENINTFGPYALKEWVRGDGGSLTMIKNPFWPGTPDTPQAKIDEVQFVFLDPETQLANFEAGTLDVSEIPTATIDRILADPVLSAQRFVGPGASNYTYGFNVEHPPFDDARARRAFSMAIDRQSIVENITKGGQIPASFFTVPTVAAAPTEEAFPGMGIYTDVEGAKALWQEYLDETGHQASDFAPTIVYNTSSTHEAIVVAMQQMWADALGVTVQPVVLDFATFLETRGEYDIMRYGWSYDYPDTHNFLYDSLIDQTRLFHWNNDAYWDLIQQALVAAPEERPALYAQAEHILVYEDAVDAPIYYSVTQDLTQPNIIRTHSLINREAYEKWDIAS